MQNRIKSSGKISPVDLSWGKSYGNTGSLTTVTQKTKTTKIIKWSKNFDKWPHRRLVTPCGSECMDLSEIDLHIKLASLGLHESALQTASRSVQPFSFRRFRVHRCKLKAPNAFPWDGKSPKIAPYHWGSGAPI